MANVRELAFPVLDISGKNYFSWAFNVKRRLVANGLEETIKENNTASQQDRAKALIFIRHHLHKNLKTDYSMKDPFVLLEVLKKRYEHLKVIILKKARNQWSQLRFQDCKSVNEYTSAIEGIKSKFRICGKNIDDNEILEKTYSTFHPLNMLLQQEFRLLGFKSYYELLSLLVVAERNNQLVMNNRYSRTNDYNTFPEVNVAPFDFKRQCESFPEENDMSYNYKRRRYENGCFKCGMINHWSRTCRTPKHLVELYQASLEKTEIVNTNCVTSFKYKRGRYENGCFKCGSMNHWSRTCRTPKHLVELYQASLEKSESVNTKFT
ncbi:uncharacterized protein [Rutidosis leptorrhynchoides]|uniref:uncharacterized protein n=1 Tax=Rutidosis leptorrhynchoides TaxID=125765 RepID=UPI003A99997F